MPNNILGLHLLVFQVRIRNLFATLQTHAHKKTHPHKKIFAPLENLSLMLNISRFW